MLYLESSFGHPTDSTLFIKITKKWMIFAIKESVEEQSSMLLQKHVTTPNCFFRRKSPYHVAKGTLLQVLQRAMSQNQHRMLFGWDGFSSLLCGKIKTKILHTLLECHVVRGETRPCLPMRCVIFSPCLAILG